MTQQGMVNRRNQIYFHRLVDEPKRQAETAVLLWILLPKIELKDQSNSC